MKLCGITKLKLKTNVKEHFLKKIKIENTQTYELKNSSVTVCINEQTLALQHRSVTRCLMSFPVSRCAVYMTASPVAEWGDLTGLRKRGVYVIAVC